MPEISTQPIVSIIIPTYNRAHLIGETLDSVLAQTYTNWECIVVDDGSTDDTEVLMSKYLKNDSRFHYLQRTEEYVKGANSCRHVGFLKAKGKYINWFDSDDIMHTNHLDEKIKKIVAGGYDFVVCEVARFRNENIEDLIPIKNDYCGNIIVNQFVGKITLSTPGPLWDTDFLKKNDLYYKSDKNEMGDSVLNDWVFGIKALMKSKNYDFIKKPLIFYRLHERSIYSDRLSGNSQNFKDEFVIRKTIYQEFNKVFGYNEEIEVFYMKRNMKILRGLLAKRENSQSVLNVILKSSKISISSKTKIIALYFISRIFNKGQHRIKYSKLQNRIRT